MSYIDNFINEIIEKRRDYLISHKETSESQTRPAFLDILLQSEMDGKPLTNEDIRGEVNTFMFAGHETTGSTLSFLMYLLATHPKEQEILYTEIKENSLLDDTPLTMRTLNSLKYLDNVIKETLRIYPIFPAVPKKCIEDMKIGDITIPANATVGIFFYMNHMDEKYFKNPKEFIPDRWNDEVTTTQRNPYVYQPFSSGLRNCIGNYNYENLYTACFH